MPKNGEAFRAKTKKYTVFALTIGIWNGLRYPYCEQTKIFQSFRVLLTIFCRLYATKFGSRNTGGGTGPGEEALPGTISEVNEVEAPFLLLLPLPLFRR